MTGTRWLPVLGMVLIAAACSNPDAVRNGVATDEGIADIALPEEQYRDMLKRNVVGTMSGSIFLARLGLDKGCELLDQEVDKVIERNLPRWRANLIAAYRNNVPADQLAEAVQKSPRSARSMLGRFGPAISNEMKNASEPLLRGSAVAVLEAMGNVALDTDRASIDMEARQRDLARMKAQGQICGVG